MRRRTRSLLVAVAMLCLPGLTACVGPNVSLSRQAQGSYDPTSSRAISAQGCGFQLFGWIPITVLNRAERAYDALVKQAPTAYITDVKVQERWTYAFIGTVYCTQLEAIAYSRP